MDHEVIGLMSEETDVKQLSSYGDAHQLCPVGSRAQIKGRVIGAGSSVDGQRWITIKMPEGAEFTVSRNEKSPEMSVEIFNALESTFEMVREEDGFFLTGYIQLLE